MTTKFKIYVITPEGIFGYIYEVKGVIQPYRTYLVRKVDINGNSTELDYYLGKNLDRITF